MNLSDLRRPRLQANLLEVRSWPLERKGHAEE
jgi:hypothetical protein